jgi:hypothetical protein
MQYDAKLSDKRYHDVFKALTVKQPYANDLVTIGKTIDGVRFGLKSIEVRSRPIKYRGDLLICSSAQPVIPGMESGVTLGFVELYDIKPVQDFTPEDWENTRIPVDKRNSLRYGYGWLMRNPRRVIEFPVKGQLGIYKLAYTKGDIQTYPEVLRIEADDYELLTGKKLG